MGMMEYCAFVMPSRIVASSNSSRMSTMIAMEPSLLGDTYGSSKFFSSSVSSTSSDGGGIRSALRALGNFAMGPDEVGRSTLNGAVVTKTWAPAGGTSGREVVSYVS